MPHGRSCRHQRPFLRKHGPRRLRPHHPARRSHLPLPNASPEISPTVLVEAVVLPPPKPLRHLPQRLNGPLTAPQGKLGGRLVRIQKALGLKTPSLWPCSCVDYFVTRKKFHRHRMILQSSLPRQEPPSRARSSSRASRTPARSLITRAPILSIAF